ncbi:uncharacterized protein LOC126968066 [Leptidea sinapis]|uniref:Uncharacterized protein n=1 Tax=Leptidea sinapis TaxID=189913 RepID=A0A5E4Q812_9NEOP|nr:uncharacterized protein LOC126968066 [Leptidea sinapis]VVC94429.1 unnamed protein product [Leptidea sinapis]
MISYKTRDNKRLKPKMARNIERLLREGKCRECSVVVTRMDFAKILGKFTKVKIQYESNLSPKTPKPSTAVSPVSKTRLKKKENGMVHIHRKTYNPHPAIVTRTRKTKVTETEIKKQTPQPAPKKSKNILKENNSCKKANVTQSNLLDKSVNKAISKQYTVIFISPSACTNNDHKSKLNLVDLLPQINKSILPSEDWCIEYFPKSLEPKDDKMYNRIAAELEDLMYNKMKPEVAEAKSEEFPSIMDILNDNTASSSQEIKDGSSSLEFKTSLESSDVEAMLLGKPEQNKDTKPTPMEVDNTDVTKLIDDAVQLPQNSEEKQETKELDNPNSPSILDETLQKGIEEQLPAIPPSKDAINSCTTISIVHDEDKSSKLDNDHNKPGEIENTTFTVNNNQVTEVTFKKIVGSKCVKAVTCMKNLKYNIQFDEKSVELLGAPKYIPNVEDLQVLLQIVNESDLQSYILY